MASTSVMWFRRDLRLHDNPALLAACAADEVDRFLARSASIVRGWISPQRR